MEKARSSATVHELESAFNNYYTDILEEIKNRDPNEHAAIIKEILEYIKKNYGENITIERMAKMACVNTYYFSTFFKNSTGYNFKSYLTEIRMKEAQKLVVTTDYKTYEIAEKVGYNNVRQFTDKFREYFGKTPSEYKKQKGMDNN